MSSIFRIARAFVVIVMLVALGALSVIPAQGQHRFPSDQGGSTQNTVTLGGWVQGDYGGSVTNGVVVHLETSEGMNCGDQPVNTAGYFEYVGLAKTYYHLTVTALGFQTYQQDLSLGTVGDKLVINVHLSPAPTAKSLPPPPSSSFTDNNASKKARKEYQKGASALHGGHLSAAESHLRKAVEEYPCYVRAQADLALVLSQKQQSPASEAALKKALECDPDFLDTYNELGQLYYNEKKYQESKAVLQEGLRRSPQSWQFYFQLGADDYHLGQFAAAEQEFLKAESLNAALPAEVHVRLADVYLKQSAYAKAYDEMQAYLRAEPNGPYTARVRSLMHQMETDRAVPSAQPATAQSSRP